MTPGRSTARDAGLAALVYLSVTVVAGWWYVREPFAPLVAASDTNLYEYTSFHFAEHLRFAPWPRLQMNSDAVFYPYGVKHVFETWSLERDYLVGFLWRWLGPGPWIKWHWLAGLFIGAWGTYLLARLRVGFTQALVLGFLASFANYYLFLKYPVHISNAVCHWITLAVITDYLVTRAMLVEGRFPLRLVLLRALFTVLGLGHDLAYTAAAGLTSLAVHAVWIASYGVARLGLSSTARQSFRAGWQSLVAALARPAQGTIALCGALVVVAFLYVPLAGQLSFESTNFPHPADQKMLGDLRHLINAPTSAARILLPFFPGWNPAQPRFELNDEPEQVGIGSVGWTFLALGACGLYCDRRHWQAYVALLVLLALFLSFRPGFTYIRELPWLRFSRVFGRWTSIYPAIFVSLSLGCVWRWPKSAWQGLAAAAVAMTLAVELIVGHAISDDLSKQPPAGPSLRPFLEVVRETPGAAVLEWPFCVTGGSGSFNGLNAYYKTNDTTSTYRRFHGKKCVGHYFGRLLPTQARPFLLAGWDQLFMPEGGSIYEPTRQKQSFDEAQWQFFTEFYQRNDFCGLVLYLDRLAPGDEAEFYRRFGEPVAQASTPWNGRMAFIPKPEALRAGVDLKRGREIKLHAAPVYELNGSWALADGDPQAAIDWFAQALLLEPRRWTALAGIADAYQQLGDEPQATRYRRRAQAALKATPEEPPP